MNCHEHAEANSARHTGRVNIDGVIGSLKEQFAVVYGDPERVAECCSHLERSLSVPPAPAEVEHLSSLLPVLAEHTGPVVIPLFDFLERTAASCADPWPLLQGMLAAREPSLSRRSLRCTLSCVEHGSLAVDRTVVGRLAELLDSPGACIQDRECLPLVGRILRHMNLQQAARSADPVESLFLDDRDNRIRRLAGMILDVPGTPIHPDLAGKALGSDSFALLAPYLAYTRASHCDVLSLLSASGRPPPLLQSLRLAEAAIGESLLKHVIADVGWPQLNFGLDVRQYVGVRSGSRIPFMLFPAEVRLAGLGREKRPGGDLFVVVAHGGSYAGSERTRDDVDPAARFRNYNLAHADVLSDFLAVAPLTSERILSILGRMENIVTEFIGLFSSLSEECAILQGVFEGIRHDIMTGLAAQEGDGPMSPDLTRLTVMFEDPQSPGEVRTLHGLKRYLHQKGLRLGFALVRRVRSTDRSVTVLLCSRRRVLTRVERIRYADFEPGNGGESNACRLPYSVALVADGFARQLLYGQESFPHVDIFCYGSEVHYFLAYGNHPAFLRINFSPPLQGGMIDLEYYGVSKYELSSHPDFTLAALQQFFRALGFYIQVENTRVHARYDKEHTPDLRSLCDRAAELFCLVPYLLDIDWTVGGLALDAEARRRVAAAWADSFVEWGVLPLGLLLTKDRCGVVERVLETPAGSREVVWDGQGRYEDPFGTGTGDCVQKLFLAAERLDPGLAGLSCGSVRACRGQLQLERKLLQPLRNALARGELTEAGKGYEPASPDQFQRVPEAEQFAELLCSDSERLNPAALLAYLIAPLERFLSFRTAGTIGSHEVQTARLSLPEEDLGIHVLRDESHSACIAFYTRGAVLYRTRSGQGRSWRSSAACNVPEFLSLLRRANYSVPSLEQVPPGLPEQWRRIKEDLARALPLEPRRPMPGEHTVAGVRATPGRAVGRVLFAGTGRTPEDFAGAVLVTAALQPHDGPLLHQAAGVVSTGGGILSHAALLAAQFRKPAIIIAGQWESGPDQETILHCVTTDFELDEREVHGYLISTRNHLREHSLVLREGDLVVIDPQEDTLRVLGRESDTLALHEELRRFGRACEDLGRAANDRDRLLFRGRKIRARHQVEKILKRMVDPILTCHAIDELLEGADCPSTGVAAGERGQLLSVLLSNASVGPTAEEHLRRVIHGLRRRADVTAREAQHRIPASRSVFEVLSLRRDVLLASQSLEEVCACLRSCGVDCAAGDPSRVAEADDLAHGRLTQLREQAASTLKALGECAEEPRCRHLLRQWERTDTLVRAPGPERAEVGVLRDALAELDSAAIRRLGERTVLWPGDGGVELFDLIGWKAAHLAEIGRIVAGELVPPWCAVTDLAFRGVLEMPRTKIFPNGTDLPGGAPTLGKAIEAVLRYPRFDRFQKSSMIRTLWTSVVLPEDLVAEVVAAYRRLGEAESGSGDPLVALRSSSHEEDAEVAARAGEFDTFLYIRGGEAVIRYLLLTWAGLWSDRALHTREILGTSTTAAGGGVIIQRIVNSRVSGVLQTINVARDDFREMVINAGWGLGEGIVSGTVAADRVIVSKEGDLEKGPLRFSYVTADKREYVIFNKRAGLGTIRSEAPYHKRLRPAMEYTELCDLVSVAARLESSYGYPLDIEFGFEGTRLWILQSRPVPASHVLLQETLEHYPCSPAGKAFQRIRGDLRHD